ncbi:hypothetical protein ACOTC5_32225 [Achromobacter xylosoxidans]
MDKKLLVAIAAALGAVAAPAFAQEHGGGSNLKCDPPVVQVPADVRNPSAQYTVTCSGPDINTVTPVITFAGEVFANGTPPYLVKSTYNIDTRGLHARKVGEEARVDQVATGTLTASTASIAALPSQFAAQSYWDPMANVLSIEEIPGQWRAFSMSQSGIYDGSVVNAGVASTPVKNGRATIRLDLGKAYSRFAGSGADAAMVEAQLGLRDGKFEVLIGDTRAGTQASIQGALAQLDKKPKDITRAWGLAARAQFLGLTDEVRYAEQKVAAHNPNLLEEFQHGVQRIKPYVLP